MSSVERFDAVLAAAVLDARPRAEVSDKDPAVALDWLRLLLPELVTYREGVFRKERFTPETADHFLAEAAGNPQAAEYVINHLHVAEDAPFGDASDVPLGAWKALAEACAYTWRTWAKDRYGLDVHTAIEPEGEPPYDYVVWFSSTPVEPS